MQRRLTCVLLCLSLAACGDPLKNVPKLSEVDIPVETTVVEALPAEIETQEDAGFFKRLMRKRNLELATAEETPVSVTVDAVGDNENADANTAKEIPITVADVEAVEPVNIEPVKTRRLWPFGRKEQIEPPTEVAAAIDEVVDVSASEVAPVTDEVVVATPEETEQDLVEPVKRAGLFGLLKPKPKPADVPDVQLASLGPIETSTQPPLSDPVVSSIPETANTTPPAKRGLFGSRRRAAKLTGPDAREIPFGTHLPFGELARVCGTPKRSLGTEVAKFPERKTKYRLYDSAPGNISPHSFYVTGFPDGCARQFTAALALFGSPVMHEQLRYGRPAANQPYSEADRAYEQVKSRVCRVGRKKPCGDKIRLLEKDTVFITIYERFGGNVEWSNLLIHKGQVMASARVGG